MSSSVPPDRTSRARTAWTWTATASGRRAVPADRSIATTIQRPPIRGRRRSAATAWTTRGNPSVAKQGTVNGELPDGQLLQNPDLSTKGLIVGLAFPSGQQVCSSLGRVTKAKNGGLVVRSTARPRSTLRLKPRKDGRVSFSFEQKTGFELPHADPMVHSVGFV